jgi:hypothetical protein
MTLSQKIAVALDENTCALTAPCSVTMDAGDNTLTLQLTALDSVGLAFTELEFGTRKRTEWTPDAIKSWGDNLSTRATYLMEPLVMLELDAAEGEVQLRSQFPTSRAEKRFYYEVRINKQGALHLARFAFDEATRRRIPVTCQMTREVLERLADDIAASIP